MLLLPAGPHHLSLHLSYHQHQYTGNAPSFLWYDWPQPQSIKPFPKPIADNHPQQRSRPSVGAIFPAVGEEFISAALLRWHISSRCVCEGVPSRSQHAPHVDVRRRRGTFEAGGEVKCIPGAAEPVPSRTQKPVEAGRVSSSPSALMMLKHVGESLQRPRSQLLHQILHFRIQHPVLGKTGFVYLFIFYLFMRPHSTRLQLGYYRVRPANREEGRSHHPILSRCRYRPGSCSQSMHSFVRVCVCVCVCVCVIYIGPVMSGSEQLQVG